MDRKCEDSEESAHLINNPNEIQTLLRGYRSSETMASSSETIVFEGKLFKTSTKTGELAATWGGHYSSADSGRLRRAHSWSGGPPEDVPSEIRILRERLVRTQARLRPGAVRHLSQHQRLTLASLALVDFMSFCSMSIMAPFFPREATEKGLSETMCGLVFSFYAVIMFLTSPFFEQLWSELGAQKMDEPAILKVIDEVLENKSLFENQQSNMELMHKHSKVVLRHYANHNTLLPALGAKFMFTAGMFVAGTCNVLFGTLVLIEDTYTFTLFCFLVRGMEALGASAYSTASYVFVVNAFPENIGSVLGILETFVGLGMSVGPAIGGLLYSIGGFGLPFYSLGIVMVLTVPINFFLLTDCDEYVSGSKTASIMRLFKIPSIIITGLVIVIVSNTWAFLDPTLEPHLRQFGLSTKQIGLIFLLFSSLYGIFSPIWGWVADRVHNHWCMMVWGLFLSTIGLLLLGPCPFIPGLPRDLWLDLVALSILGMSVALTLLPTFQGVLTSSIYEGGCPEALTTYSAVAGVWSCCYSLGEVLGPALGAALSQRYGFPLCATLCAAACFTMAVVTLTFFSLRESSKWIDDSDSISSSMSYSDTTWNSNQFCHSAPESRMVEKTPLLSPCSCSSKAAYYVYGTPPSKQICLAHNRSKKSGSASIADVIIDILKFQYLTNINIRIRKFYSKSKSKPDNDNEELYQNYLENNEPENDISKPCEQDAVMKTLSENNNTIVNNIIEDDSYCSYLDKTIFGPVAVKMKKENMIIKRNNKGIVAKLVKFEDKQHSDEIIKHNIQKVHFYEQIPECATLDIFDGCDCRDDVTYVRGTVTVSSTGACEV